MTKAYSEMEDLRSEQRQREEEEQERQQRFEVFKRQEEIDIAKAKVKEYYETTFKQRQEAIREHLKEVERLKQVYIEALKPLNDFITVNYNESFKYWAMINKYKLDHKELGIPSKFHLINNIAPLPRVMTISEYDINKKVKNMD